MEHRRESAGMGRLGAGEVVRQEAGYLITLCGRELRQDPFEIFERIGVRSST